MRVWPRRLRLSVRARAVVAAVLAIAPLLTGASIAAVVIQGHDLTRATELVAEEQARLIARELGSEPSAVIRPSIAGEDTLVQVVRPDGEVAEASGALSGRRPLLPEPRAGSVTSRRVSGLLEGEGDRYLVVAVPSTASGGYVVAARSLESVDAATGSTTGILGFGVPMVTLVVAALSWVLAGRALIPVERLRRRAAEISDAGAGARLPELATGDEIEGLARTLNHMLDRLDGSVAVQRRFVADASHELRSPVAAIRAVVEVADRVPTDWAEVRDDLLKETRRLEGLVQALLTLARRDATTPAPDGGERERVRLAVLLDNELARPRRLAVVRTDRADPWVWGDRRALGSALSNLLDNADRHGRTHIEVVLDATQDQAVLMISDDGPGVPRDDAERVFDRFVRLDEARSRDAGGAGLGLAIVRAVAADHDGWVAVDLGYQGPGARLELHVPRIVGAR